MDIAELWDICIEFMWDDTYIAGLDEFLKSYGVRTILDCGGGTGFPSLQLRRLGWDITYSDGSEVMVERFQQKLSEGELTIPCYRANWLSLSRSIPRRFDAALCRGNALIYVDSWDGSCVTRIAKQNIREALGQFYRVLNDGGLLYVDITNKKEFDQASYPIEEEFGERIICGKRVKLVWRLTHNYRECVRTWESILVIDGQEYNFAYYSYLLRHKELIDLLKEAGFSDVEEVKIKGETNYNVFVALK